MWLPEGCVCVWTLWVNIIINIINIIIWILWMGRLKLQELTCSSWPYCRERGRIGTKANRAPGRSTVPHGASSLQPSALSYGSAKRGWIRPAHRVSTAWRERKERQRNMTDVVLDNRTLIISKLNTNSNLTLHLHAALVISADRISFWFFSLQSGREISFIFSISQNLLKRNLFYTQWVVGN